MLQAGFARVDITPPFGTMLTGYFALRVSDGIKDPTIAYDGGSALLTGITPPCYSEIRGQNNFTDSPRY